MAVTAVLRVVRGDATPEELAAVVALLARSGGTAPAPAAATPSRWNDRAAGLRQLTGVGPGAWGPTSWRARS